MHATLPLLKVSDFPSLRRQRPEILQVNLGYRCNQTCVHCHVNAGPRRKEVMERNTIDEVVAFLKASGVKVLDLTGGAPEMNPHFRNLVRRARALDVHVMDRCNLTILEEPGEEDLAEFLAAYQVEIVASLPCYLEENVDRQRGKGVYDASIRALRSLNELGYGKEGSRLVLNLVYNPLGPTLPPPRTPWRPSIKSGLAIFTASYSTGCIRLRTCPSSGLAACSSPRADSRRTWICCAIHTSVTT